MSSKQVKTGLLLVNLGTPDAPTPEAVGRYLKEFLMDPWVVDVPWPIRWILVNVLIVPRRKHSSAEAYQTVWTKEGSPLRVFHDQFVSAVGRELHDLGFSGPVVGAMRYGEPSIRSGLEAIKKAGCESVVVWPLYPQYAESTTRSILDLATEISLELGLKPRAIREFFADPGFLDPSAVLIQREISELGGLRENDRVLFSFHGLPERHVRKTDRSEGRSWCLIAPDCCATLNEANRDCYRAHCFATARELAGRLGLRAEQSLVSFQSRLGRDPWIRPYTDEVLKELAEKGVRRLVVATPSFVADCLETLEEVRVRAAEDFRKFGGELLVTVPCLNADQAWIKAASQIALSELENAPIYTGGAESGPSRSD